MWYFIYHKLKINKEDEYITMYFANFIKIVNKKTLEDRLKLMDLTSDIKLSKDQLMELLNKSINFSELQVNYDSLISELCNTPYIADVISIGSANNINVLVILVVLFFCSILIGYISNILIKKI